jgi:hypothetical protein
LSGTDHELVELRIPPLKRRRLSARDLPLPPGAIVLGTLDRDTTLKRADEELSGEEHVFVVIRASERRELERGLARLAKEAAE